MNKIPPILKQSAQFIKGVGPRKIKLLNKLDIYTIEDLLYHFPRRYEDRSQFKLIRELEVGAYETIKGKVLASGLRRTRTRMTIFQLAVSDESGVVYGTWFNQPYLKDVFQNGDEVVLYGKVERYGKLQMNSPEYELLNPQDEDESMIHTGRIVPIYALTFGLGQRYLRKLIKSTLDSYLGQIDE
ncbi:MAG: DNA helicase RecG, partial [Candidatus Omnitrophica bacterium]|nr:DNA helicase RecG [Candidatus Omnitrophota bacterium]